MIDRNPYIRPSNIAAMELCQGKPLLEARAVAAVPAVDRIERHAADQGTKGHLVAAQALGLIYGVKPWNEPSGALDRMAKALDLLEPWAADATRRCVAYVVSVVDREVAAGWQVSVLIEVHLSGKGVDIDRGGTADVVIVCRDADHIVARVVVIDHKLGWLDQGHAAEHAQLGTYAVMAWDRWSTAGEIEVHLSQGRRMDFSSALYRDEQIEGMRTRVRAAVEASQAEAPPVRASLDACRYCRALTLCRTAREHIMHAAEELALFGDSTADRIRLADDATLARRFAEDAKALAKVWQQEQQDKASRKAGAA